MQRCDLILDFFAIHFGEPEVPENASQLFAIDIAGVIGVVKLECVLDFVVLHYLADVPCLPSLLLADPMFLPLLMFFFGLLMIKVQ